MANEITELFRRDRKWEMDAKEDLERFFLYKIDEIKWQSNTEQSVLKSKDFYLTGDHFTGLIRWYFVFTATSE
jgi:hypothetical protein